MKHIVSFETAKALKAAGYPQPEFEPCQFWYNWNGTPIMAGPKADVKSEFETRFFNLETGGVGIVDPNFQVCFYAPSATEIMEQEIMAPCVLTNVFMSHWKCVHPFYGTTFDENPAESAAKMFINLAKSL